MKLTRLIQELRQGEENRFRAKEAEKLHCDWTLGMKFYDCPASHLLRGESPTLFYRCVQIRGNAVKCAFDGSH